MSNYGIWTGEQKGTERTELFLYLNLGARLDDHSMMILRKSYWMYGWVKEEGRSCWYTLFSNGEVDWIKQLMENAIFVPYGTK